MPKVKKVKKTKAQLEEERLAAEEADRKNKELEDKKLVEEAERRRLEGLRIAVEHAAFRQDEMERLIREYKDMVNDTNDRECQKKIEEEREGARSDWQKYRDPSDDPDPSSQRDLNTFLSQILEQDLHAPEQAFEIIRKLEKVAFSVLSIWADSVADGNNKMRSLMESYLIQFSNMIVDKLEKVSAHHLRFADEHINDKKELQLEDGTDRVFVGLWTTFQDPRPNRKAVEFEKVGVRVDIPKQILQHDGHFIHRVVRLPIETLSCHGFNPEAKRMDYPFKTEKYVVGDLFMMDILRPPPSAYTIRARRWVVRDKSSQSLNLQKNAYPSTVPCKISLRVPEELFVMEDTTMALWDEAEGCWTDDGVTDFQYTENTQQATFYTTAIGLFALVKFRTSEMPYRSWSLRPLLSSERVADPSHPQPPSANLSSFYERYARFTIQTQTTELVIDILHTKCKLIKPVVRQVQDLIGKELSPGVLLHQLQRRGMNLFPTDMDAKRCHKNKGVKNPDMELSILAEISRCAGALDFHSCDWSKKLDENKFALFARETSAFTGDVEHFDYETVLAESDISSKSYLNAPAEGTLPGPGVKYTVVLGNEYGNKVSFSNVPRPNEVTHLSLSEAMSRRVMPEALERIQRTNVRFQKTVFTLLSIVKPFSLG